MLQAAQAHFAPQFARAHAAQNSNALLRNLIGSCCVTTVLFLPVFVATIWFPVQSLSLFGAEFAHADYGVLQVMAIGQGIRMLSGNSEIFLSMVDRPKTELTVLVISILCFLTVAFVATDIEPPIRVAWAYATMLTVRGALSLGASLQTLVRHQRCP